MPGWVVVRGYRSTTDTRRWEAVLDTVFVREIEGDKRCMATVLSGLKATSRTCGTRC